MANNFPTEGKNLPICGVLTSFNDTDYLVNPEAYVDYVVTTQSGWKLYGTINVAFMLVAQSN